MKYYLVTAEITDGENEYTLKIILVTADKTISWDILARRYFADFFGEDTKADDDDWRRFWAPNDERCVTIKDGQELTEAEFDFLKHFFNTSTPNIAIK